MPITADFPTWFRAGCYGGLGCSLLAAVGIAAYALARRRGTPRQLAGAMLGCLAAALCILPAIIWNQTRLDLKGPALSISEILLWLAWVAVIGWMLPLGVSAGFLLLAPPFDQRQRVGSRALRSVPGTPSSEEHQREPLGSGIAWGRLVYLEGPYNQRQVALSRQVILVGRERDNDILLDTDLASRYHAEVRLDRGRAYLLDRGSMNGTSLNGQKIWGLSPLQHGDLLDIGGQHFRYEDLTAQAHTTASSPPGRSGAGEPAGETSTLAALTPQPSRAAPGARLIISGGPTAGQSVALRGAVVTIGRDSACDVVIPDASISRQHSQILRQESGWYVQDLGSRNGTALNGERLSAPHRLEDGDSLMLGAIPLRYLAASAQGADETPAEARKATMDASEEAPTEETTRGPRTRALPPKPPTMPLQGRENRGPLRLPSRTLAQPAASAPETPADAANPAPAHLSNSVFRPHRLIADRAHLAPIQQPPSSKQS